MGTDATVVTWTRGESVSLFSIDSGSERSTRQRANGPCTRKAGAGARTAPAPVPWVGCR